jgi:hypothetical protein
MPNAQTALTEFFTKDRLEYYRDLHERYRLWCGDWPEGQLAEPDASSFLPYNRLSNEARSLVGSRFVNLEFTPEPTPDYAPPPRLLEWEPGQKQPQAIQDPAPPAGALILAAMNYTLARWQSGYGPGGSGEPYVTEAFGLTDLLDNWGQKLLQSIEAVEPAAVGIMEDRGPTGHRLYMTRERFLRTDPESPSRETRFDALKDYWLWIGRAVGIMPGVQGGTKCTLDDRLLAGLLNEGEELIRAVAELAPSFDERLDLFQLLRRDALSDDDNLRIGTLMELQRRYPEEAKQGLDRFLKRTHGKLRTDEWLYRLRFPMLSAKEIQQIRSKWARGQKRSTRFFHIASEILSARLSIRRQRLLDRTAEFRK